MTFVWCLLLPIVGAGSIMLLGPTIGIPITFALYASLFFILRGQNQRRMDRAQMLKHMRDAWGGED